MRHDAAVRVVVRRLTSLPLLTVDAQGQEVSVGVSVGWIIVEPDEDLDRALRRADTAMYNAKRGQPDAISSGHTQDGAGSPT